MKTFFKRDIISKSAALFGWDTTVSLTLSFLLWSLGICFLVWAFFDERFRDVEGFLQGRFCLSISVGVALLIVALAVHTRWKQFAFWFAVAMVGHAVALQMVEAGQLIRYQHYKTFDRLLTGNHPLLLTYLAVQTGLVIAGLRVYWPKIKTWLGHHVNFWQFSGITITFLLSSAAMSRQISTYLAELCFAAFVQTVNIGNIVVMLWALPEQALTAVKQGFERLFGQAAVEYQGSMLQNSESQPSNMPSKRRRLDLFAVLAAIWVISLAAVLSFFVYERHPHVPDEVIYLYHARYFADGRLTVPAPPVPEAFAVYMVPHQSDRWYSIFPPGWPAILAVGVLLGVPWLINPVLAGLNLLLTYVFVQEIYDRRAARLVILLLCISPWHVFMSMNFMAHTFTLTSALAASLAMAQAKRTGKTVWGWLAGLATGAASLVRPLDGLIVAGLLGLWAIASSPRLKAISLAAFVFGAAIVSAIVLPYNQLLTGQPTVFPLTAYYEEYFGPKTNALGFGPERGLSWALDAFPGHSPIEAVINAALNIFSVNIELFGWSTGSVLLIAILMFSGWMRRSDYMMLAVVTATIGMYSLYWFSGGPDFGARYWYLLLIPLVVMTVRGVEVLEKMLQGISSSSGVKSIYATSAVVSLCAISLVNYFPWRSLDKYHHYLRMHADIRDLAREYRFAKSLVLIRGDEHPDYASAWAYNPLEPYANAPVYAWDRDAEVRARLLKAYRDRPVWLVEGPTITHAGFRVVAGPLSADTLLVQNGEKRKPVFYP